MVWPHYFTVLTKSYWHFIFICINEYSFVDGANVCPALISSRKGGLRWASTTVTRLRISPTVQLVNSSNTLADVRPFASRQSFPTCTPCALGLYFQAAVCVVPGGVREFFGQYKKVSDQLPSWSALLRAHKRSHWFRSEMGLANMVLEPCLFLTYHIRSIKLRVCDESEGNDEESPNNYSNLHTLFSWRADFISKYSSICI